MWREIVAQALIASSSARKGMHKPCLRMSLVQLRYVVVRCDSEQSDSLGKVAGELFHVMLF